MATITSKDGTKIAYSKIGQGPSLILVDGALCYRDFGPAKGLADLLKDQFTVYIYDRRGRGESDDTQPYSLQKEIEDIEAITTVAKEPVYLFGQSSGGVLAIEAANALGINKIVRLAVYETPLFVDNSREPLPKDFMERLHSNIHDGKNGAAVKQFMKLVGAPSFFLAIMPLTPMWKKLKGVAPTLEYDFEFMKDLQQGKQLSSTQWANATMPTLAMTGGKSPAWMKNAVKQVATVLPNSNFSEIPGQNHMINAAVLAPLIKDFFLDKATVTAPLAEAV